MSKISGIAALGLVGLLAMSTLAVGAYAMSDNASTHVNGTCDQTQQQDRDGSCGQCASDCDQTPDQTQDRTRDRVHLCECICAQ